MSEPTSKVCTKCEECKPIVGFALRAGALDGRRGVCRLCKTAGHKEWRDANRDHVRENGRKTMQKLYAANPAKFKEKRKAEYAADPQKYLAVSKKWKDGNREQVQAYSRQYRIENLSEVSSKLSAWRVLNPDASRRHARAGRDRLSDSYVAKALVARRAEVPAELINLKREQLMIHRLSKTLKSQIKEATK